MSADGNSLLWDMSASSLPATTLGPPVPSDEVLPYLFVRGTNGWSDRPAIPADTAVIATRLNSLDSLYDVSDDLATSISTSLDTSPGGTLQISSGTTAISNLVSYDGTTLTQLTPLVQTSPVDQTANYTAPTYVGESSTADHVVYLAAATFPVQNGTAPGGSTATPPASLYDYSGGGLWQVGLETDDVTPFASGEQALVGPGVVSSDGSHVFFGASTNPSVANQLFVRENDTSAGATTVPVSISTRSPTDPSCISNLASNPGGAPDTAPATFEGATPDGSIVFFLSNCELTNDSDTGAGDAHPDLYMYDVSTGALTDLSVGIGTAGNAQGVVGFSSDGSYVYFVADGQITSSAPNDAIPKLYLYHAGSITYLGELSPSDSPRAWTPGPPQNNVTPVGSAYQSLDASVTADGQHLLIASAKQLTSYANGTATELYEYDASGGTWTCVSCNPSGAPPTGSATMAVNSLSQDGSEVFFTTPDALVSGDTNTVDDVYEWEATAQPSSTDTAADPYGGGSISLLSSGNPPAATTPAGAAGSWLIAASPTGSDVFFITRDQLVAQDQDEETDVYDARVDGTSPPPPPTTGTPCAAALDGSCQPAVSSPPTFAPPVVNTAGTNVTTTITRTTSSTTSKVLTLTLVRPTASKLRAAARSGRLPLAVRVSGAATVVVAASAVIGGRRVGVASGSESSHGAGTVAVTLTLSKAAKHVLATGKRLSLLVKASARGAATRDLPIELET